MRVHLSKPITEIALSLSSILEKSSSLSSLKKAHAKIFTFGIQNDSQVLTKLTTLYISFNSIDIASVLFKYIANPNSYLWNVMIRAYACGGQFHQSLELYCLMMEKGLRPDKYAFPMALKSCAALSDLPAGRLIHQHSVCCGCGNDLYIDAALVDMYAKCGEVEAARQVFDKMSVRDLVCWTSMVSGYVHNGCNSEALEFFDLMRCSGVKPNRVGILSVLLACGNLGALRRGQWFHDYVIKTGFRSDILIATAIVDIHSGLIEEGNKYFRLMREEFGIEPKLSNYSCMVDLLGRSGQLSEAEKLIQTMPVEPDVSILGSLLGACRVHGNIDLAEKIADWIFQLDPFHVGYHVLLSNIYAAKSRWVEVEKIRKIMARRGTNKIEGFSLIEHNILIHKFGAGDKSHPQSEKIYSLLEELATPMKRLGYMPLTDCVLHDIEGEAKEAALSYHSSFWSISEPWYQEFQQ
ncbi:tetratricopeptide repeat (TPR)-like superfamily protein [Actinidia rufa]|uniref:Tetratricopeptide repeat (TPR)-like superfamily protein n=1 Tax=Actinidia rufa TaxID=165716 RepID=A0A7J0EB00_9ERIC|nr:tetratricopeptide repeat (TPR)-like superfamily protein [Actinidia rufa]